MALGYNGKQSKKTVSIQQVFTFLYSKQIINKRYTISMVSAMEKNTGKVVRKYGGGAEGGEYIYMSEMSPGT